jgi:hypothetical protein
VEAMTAIQADRLMLVSIMDRNRMVTIQRSMLAYRGTDLRFSIKKMQSGKKIAK